MRTVYPGTPVPAASVKAAVIVAVPVGAMTGVGVLSLKVEMGAGGATVTSITLPFVPVRGPFVAPTDAITLPLITGTAPLKWARPPASVVPPWGMVWGPDFRG